MNNVLTPSQSRTLSVIADIIIPPAPEYDVPGAGDESICAAIMRDASGKFARFAAALDRLHDKAQETHGRAFHELEAKEGLALAHAFREQSPSDAQLLEVLVSQCYYRDERVMRSLGLEVRPPHPQGFDLEQGDWSLLDPVRRLAPMYRAG